MSDHPWSYLPDLVAAEIITKEEARDDIIFAHRSAHRRAFRELQALIPELAARDEISPKGIERIQRVIITAQSEELPDS